MNSRVFLVLLTLFRPASLRWMFCLTLCQFVSIANATGNFIPISFKHGISVELPKNWVALSDNRRITLDTWTETIVESAGITEEPPADLNFAAKYYDDHGKTAAGFFIRYYPTQTITQADSRIFTVADTKEIDDLVRTGLELSMKQTGARILLWKGTKKQSINGIVAFVTEYSQSAIRKGDPPFRVQLVRVLNAGRSFTVSVSYLEDQEFFLRKICDRVIQSIRM